MDSLLNQIEISQIRTEKIKPNPWNPNRMSPAIFQKLKNEISKNGFLAPITVRRTGDFFEIIDGEHRWKVAGELGHKTVPCFVCDMKDTGAKIKTLQLNGLHGENDPELLADLLAELSEELGYDQLEKALPWSEYEIEQIVKIACEDKDGILQRDFSDREYLPPEEELFMVVVTTVEKLVIQNAINKECEISGTNEGQALAVICENSVPAI
jgi:ParB/RepB/Spo0J family partition protein